ncbi:MAG: DUF1810 domain-containing protein [Gallicola sp.]|nr:DUF1810 domain-containing protein [Gallicola sp.]
MLDRNRFLQAQKGSYSKALEEIKRGKKETHWIWYIFPQLKDLGQSRTAKFYGIENRKEAEDYLGDPVLKDRLIEISKALLELESSNPRQVMGDPDYKKLQSSMTLFDEVSDEEVFQKVLGKFYGEIKDEETLRLLKKEESL